MKHRRRWGYGWGWSLLALFVGLALLTVVGLSLWGQYQSMTAISQQLDDARPWFTLWRWTLYGVVIGGWPRWITALARYGDWDDVHRTHLLCLRWRVAAWLLVLELLLAQNLMGHFIQTYGVVGDRR